jgi:hypothetical protein
MFVYYIKFPITACFRIPSSSFITYSAMELQPVWGLDLRRPLALQHALALGH